MFITIVSLYNPDETALIKENKDLKQRIKELTSRYNDLSDEIKDISKSNDELRIAANLTPISEEERNLGIGGEKFNLSGFDFINSTFGLNSAFSFLEEIKRRLNYEKENYNQISSRFKENTELFESIPSIKPCEGEYLVSTFGVRFHPILKITRMHEGIDVNLETGSPIWSTANGKVEFAGIKNGYGITVEIDHGHGYRTTYAHLSEVLVVAGQEVKRGEVIALSGNTGLSTGPHLHYEVQHNGEKLNPVYFFFEEISLSTK